MFGLGSGVHFMLVESGLSDPGVLMFGRSATMEVDLADALGLDYAEQTEADDRKAWQVVREEVLASSRNPKDFIAVRRRRATRKPRRCFRRAAAFPRLRERALQVRCRRNSRGGWHLPRGFRAGDRLVLLL